MDIPGYTILHRIGEGAMASVYLAVQTSLGRQVALKILAPALAARKGFTARFLNEGRIIAYLKHPQIVDIYDLGSHHHNYFLAMEFLSAGTLEQRIKKGISPSRSVQLIKQIATALGFAHQLGVIHRDIKPQNILFRDDGIPVLTDFGIARLMDGGPQLTVPGHAMGSPLYMSPEQINGCTIDARADLYALGILFYMMLTRKLPYESDHIMTIALMHKSAPLPVLPDELSAFQPVVNQLLAKNPDHRFSSAQELIDALVRVESANTFTAGKTDRSEAVPRPATSLYRAGGLGLLESEPTQGSNATSFPGLEPTLGADQAKVSPPEQDSSKIFPNQPARKHERVVRGAPESRSARKKRVILGGISMALIVGLLMTVGVFRPAPILSWLQPAPHSLSTIETDSTLHPAEDHETIKTQQPPEASPTLPRRDPAPAPETAPSNRPAVDQKVGRLLAKAQAQLTGFRLTAPVGDNSYETAQQILALDRSNQGAESIIARIMEVYRRLALGAKAKDRLQQSLKYVGKGLRIRPEDPMLLALRTELHKAIADKIRIENEQARLAERKKRQHAAEQAASEVKRKAEAETARRRRQEAESARREDQSAKQEKEKQEKRKSEIGLPDGAEKDADRPNRLFGTF
jgi:serine/threonine protein kinase